MIEEFVFAFITIFVILDPFASLPAFLTLTSKMTDDEKKATANKAIVIAGVLALVFMVGGVQLLKYLGIKLGSFKVAGGIILGIMGLETVLDFSIGNAKHDVEGIAVLIATPLLTGPGMMATLVVLTNQVGMATTTVAALTALFIAWLVLSNAVLIKKAVGQQIINITSKIMGLILLALAIEFISSGLAATA